MPWRVLPLLAVALFFVRNWAIAGSEVLRAELADQRLTDTRTTVAQFDCMGNAMLEQLPSSRTRIGFDIADGMWVQRLTEIAYPRHDIVADIADAQHVVAFAAEPGECGPPQVIVTPR